jgi:hypothetical protein
MYAAQNFGLIITAAESYVNERIIQEYTKLAI